ncbi:MAG TPA: PhoH family protein [Chitinophagales bacterium]|nr:PhoH family protein [Chitinophagales bacterium]MBP6154055.1 PhoH family protein [Chitinophagales bacterium]HQW78771.1 PhoH family protein [Chitinophagales bacterium]HRB18585.1 PhoH family protein [Chitinophagales bacterium]HRB68634.1 PhoH family protein [Chitinophagales bacterium]
MSELTIKLETVDPVEFFGFNNNKLKILKKEFNRLNISARGNKIIVAGAQEDLEIFNEKVHQLVEYLERYGKISDQHLEEILHGRNPYETNFPQFQDNVLVYGNNGMLVRARTENQQKMVELSEENDILFALGPAGTGKTYTAVALAVRALKNKSVKKIILTRPAVEAGESLGFLPGDLKEKIDPYLRPLYDALDDMIPADKLAYYMQNRVIEVAPLAYMRGRTLDNAFMILDEAQNSTTLQLKMFLTRIGPSAQCIITGDMSQIDLPKNQQSGLKKTLMILEGIKGIGMIHLTSEDVVRHRLVKEIIKAFDNDAAREQQYKDNKN